MQFVFAFEAQCYLGKEVDKHVGLLLLEHNCKRVENKVSERYQSKTTMGPLCHPARECLPNSSVHNEC